MRFRRPPQPEKTEEEKQIDALILAYSGRKIKERWEVERVLSEMGPSAFDTLIARQQEWNLARKRHLKTVLGIAIFLCGVCWLAPWLVSLLIGLRPSYWSTLPAVFQTIFYLVFISSHWKSGWNSSSQLLAKFEDVRAVGPLAQALEFGNGKTQREAGDALIRLLPRMQASDASSLTAEQYGSLLKALLGRRKDLKLAILKALEQIGDEFAIDNVTLLTRSRDADIQEAATACLPFLLQRGEQAKIRQSLLRPSEASGSPDILLRPAVATEAAEPQQLLRAVEEETSAYPQPSP